MAMTQRDSGAAPAGLEINAAFLRNHRGDVCIAFSDPAYVRSEGILVDPAGRTVDAILHDKSFRIGSVSDSMINAFVENETALLTAVMPDGDVFEMAVPIHMAGA